MTRSFCVLLLAAACATTETPAPAPAPAAAAEPAKPPPPPAEPPPALQLPSHTRPVSYALELTLLTTKERFSGREDIQLELSEPRRVLWLHGRNLEVTAATANGQSGKWEQVNSEGLAKLTFDTELPKGHATLHLEWSAAYDPALTGIYLSKEAGETYVGSQFETHFARRGFPCFDDPQFKTPWDISVIIDAKHQYSMNTNPVETKPLEGGLQRVTFGRTQPLPSYLLNFAVGPFDVVTPAPLPPNDVRKHPLQVRGFAPKGRGPELAYALSAGNELLVELEHYFGVPFPYEKLDHIALPDNFGGAMENAGAITYTDNALLFKEGVSSEDTRLSISTTMAHEMAHQWFGDLVTMRWWTDIWLNESFAEWLGVRTVDQWKPAMQARIHELDEIQRAMDDDSLVSSRTIRHPLEKMEEVQDQFDNLTYQKGGAVLAMFESWLGAERFRQGVHDYLVAHAHQSGSTAELLQSFSAAAKVDITPAFTTFLEQNGVPLVKVKVVCEPKKARLELSQSRWLPVGTQAQAERTWKLPFCAKWGEGKSAQSKCMLLETATGTLPIPSGACPDWVNPNPDAAGYYHWALEAPELAKLKAKGKLSPAEKLSLANNLNAAVKSGTLLFADAMPTLEWLLQDDNGEPAMQAVGLMDFAYLHGAPSELQPKVGTYVAKLLRARLAKLGWKPAPKETPDRLRLRTRLVGVLALEMKDPQTLDQASKLGHAYVGTDGKFHPEVVSPDLAGAVMAAAVKADPKVYATLIDRMGTLEDGEMRFRILAAIGAAEDPAVSDQVIALWKDPKLRTSELAYPYYIHMQEPRMRDRVWKAFQNDFEGLMPKLEPMFRGNIPIIAAGFCDEEHAKDVEQFFKSHLDKFPEIKRPMDHTLEQIQNCIALKQTQQASITAFFSKK
ncbi:MAG: M1 family metallopeptidase [Myxococcaceae bacterium]